jgi:hypothetical protein
LGTGWAEHNESAAHYAGSRPADPQDRRDQVAPGQVDGHAPTPLSGDVEIRFAPASTLAVMSVARACRTALRHLAVQVIVRRWSRQA